LWESAPAAEVPEEGEQSRDHQHEADDGGEEDGKRHWYRRLPTDAILVRGGDFVGHENLVKRESGMREQNLIERISVRYAL